MGDRHVFVSYCRENKRQVNELHDELVRHGFSVWWDDQLLGGQNWKLELRRALRNCGAVLACFSEEVAKRDATGMFPELQDAIDAYRHLKPGSIYLIPVRLSECQIPDLEINATTTLQDLQYIDLFPTADRDEGIARLVASLSKCSLLRRSECLIPVADRGRFLIAQKAFRVGKETDPIDEASTSIVIKGPKDAIVNALRFLQNRYGDQAVSSFDSGEDVHEVMVSAPVSSLEMAILERRCSVHVESIDHVPEPFNSEFKEQLRRYLASDDVIEKRFNEAAGQQELE